MDEKQLRIIEDRIQKIEMTQAKRKERLLRFMITAALILILAAIPNMITVHYTFTSIHWKNIWLAPFHFITGLFTEKSFYFLYGTDQQFMLDVIFSYLLYSFKYILIAAFFSILIGLVFGVVLAHPKRAWMEDIIGFFSMIPDFIIILFLQLLVVYLYKSTGIQFARVASFSTLKPAVLLPVLTLIIVPSLYLVRTLASHTYDVITEDYIRTALAKGIKIFPIYKNHVIRNVIPFLKADLHKLLAIMFGNLFIVEYLFNLRGITQLIITYIFPVHMHVFGMLVTRGAYQYNVAALSFSALVLLYLAVYWVVKRFIWLIERVFANE